MSDFPFFIDDTRPVGTSAGRVRTRVRATTCRLVRATTARLVFALPRHMAAVGLLHEIIDGANSYQYAENSRQCPVSDRLREVEDYRWFHSEDAHKDSDSSTDLRWCKGISQQESCFYQCFDDESTSFRYPY